VTCIPEGTQWSNNSCAYDAIVTILFNIWREEALTNNATWSDIGNSLMTGLVHGFNNHINGSLSGQHWQSLEDVREQMQRGMIYISAEFQFGLFTSIPSVLRLVLQHGQTITSCVRRCAVSTHPSIQEGSNKTCLITPLSYTGQSLQQHLDNFQHELMSRCRVCNERQMRVTTFHHLPPLLAFDLTGGLMPTLPLTISIIANEMQQTFTLKGVIHYAHNHFTAHVRLATGTWFHDGMVTGRALRQQPLQQQHFNTAISTIYSRVTVT
jgi:hypothetical protein